MQARLLRVLQEGEFEPVGTTRAVEIDVRVIAATNRDLKAEVDAGRFRKDLYYHLNVISLSLPPLSQRTQDIPLLANHFIGYFNAVHGRDISSISDAALAALIQAPFPGNIRELENAIEFAFVVCRGPTIEVWDLPEQFNSIQQPPPESSLDNPLQAAEATAIRSALARHQGNRTKAAESLGISRHTLWRKMKKLGMHPWPR